MKRYKFKVNGKPVTVEADDNRTLLWALRNDLELTGTKYGCGDGVCGSCTVVVDGEAVRSCQATVSSVQGKDVLTIEGLETDGRLHPLQQAFVDHGALQCGYCTPGMVMNAYALLKNQKSVTRAQIVEGMEDNLCRCGAHGRIVAAIEDVAKRQGGAR